MEKVFLELLNMSIVASWIVLAIVIFRRVFPKAPKYIRVILWAFVGIRLICPFTIESAISLVPSANTVPQAICAISDLYMANRYHNNEWIYTIQLCQNQKEGK